MPSNSEKRDRRVGRAVDPFSVAIMAAIGVAAFLPARGEAARVFGWVSTAAIAGLFFSHGAALSFGETLAGLRQWRLHLLIFATTFIVFPIVILPLKLLPAALLPADLFLGFLYLAALPSAVSGSIAFTAMAEGNVAAAICASATSNTIGLMVTPFIVAVTMHGGSSGPFDLSRALGDVAVQLLLPFGLGQLIHPRVRALTERHAHLLRAYDQGVIVLVIYVAFSQSVADGLWARLPLPALLVTIFVCASLMVVVVLFEQTVSRWLGFSRRDEIAAVFCGSKKSLASGLPLAEVLFGHAPSFGMIIVPIMIYNQVQNLIGAVLARRYAARQPPTAEARALDDRNRTPRRR